MSAQRIAILPGDGIGLEVIAEARRVLEWFIAHRALPVELEQHAYGAGKGIANPLGAILSVAMMLRLSQARPDDATLLERTVGAALAHGARTADLCAPGATPVSCSEMGSAVLRELDRLD